MKKLHPYCVYNNSNRISTCRGNKLIKLISKGESIKALNYLDKIKSKDLLVQNSNGKTALMLACKKLDSMLALAILKKVNKNNLKQLNMKDNKNNTPLTWACCNLRHHRNMIEVIKELFKYGVKCSPWHQNIHNLSALDYLMNIGPEEEVIEILPLFNSLESKRKKKIFTLNFYQACHYKNEKIALHLLKNYPELIEPWNFSDHSINMMSKYQISPFLFACISGNRELCLKLIKCKPKKIKWGTYIETINNRCGGLDLDLKEGRITKKEYRKKNKIIYKTKYPMIILAKKGLFDVCYRVMRTKSKYSVSRKETLRAFYIYLIDKKGNYDNKIVSEFIRYLIKFDLLLPESKQSYKNHNNTIFGLLCEFKEEVLAIEWIDEMFTYGFFENSELLVAINSGLTNLIDFMLKKIKEKIKEVYLKGLDHLISLNLEYVHHSLVLVEKTKMYVDEKDNLYPKL